MQTFWQDLRYGVRTLAKAPGFALFSVGVLALGIAANTSIFSFANTVLLRPLPYRDPGRLVMVWEDASYLGFPTNTPAPGNFYDWKEQNDVFDDMAATRDASFSLTGSAVPEEILGRQVSWNLFRVLGVRPLLGRDFVAEEDNAKTGDAAILSHALWRQSFGADPHIVGRKIELDNQEYTVIGVMPQGFEFPDRASAIWVPLGFSPEQATNHHRHFLQVVARLKPGVTLAQANANLATVSKNLAEKYPDSNTHIGAYAVPLRQDRVGNLRLAIYILLGAVGFVLLIACANVANLLLARAAGRQRELAVRMALGAGRQRILRQLLTESLLLAGLAGIVGIMLSFWGAALLSGLVPAGVPLAPSSGIGARVLLFSVFISIDTGVFFGIMPALRLSSVNLSDALKRAGGHSGFGAHGKYTRNLLVVVEVALAVILLSGAGLMIRTFANLRLLNPGFDTDRVLTLHVPLPEPKYSDLSKRTAFYDQVLERVNRVPGVVAAGFTTWMPLTNRGGSSGFTIDGQPPAAPGEFNDANLRLISKDYVRVMSMTLKTGRLFTGDERRNSPLELLVNETMAGQFWPGGNPLGQRIKLGGYASDDPWFTIIGIVSDVHQMALNVPPRAEMYIPYPQYEYFAPGYLAVKTTGDPLRLAAAIRDQIWAVDKEQPVADVKPMQAIVDEELAPRQLQATILGIFSGLALILASLGIYAVLSYAVAQRTREIGLRIALGAQKGDVLRMVTGQGLALTLTGLAIGLAGALALTRVLTNLLYGVSASDPVTFMAVGVLLSSVALLASYIPARRAMRVDPMVALRYE
ncbi:MAG: ABC transporter permease [Candidatus Acidiferrales bacterium]